jgi:succinate dehydrogenase/fumarate reductase flavoprotein subunit
MAQGKISRRDWVKGAGAAGIASVVGAGDAAAQATRPPRRWDRDTDVVVIGAGATGFPAAIVAREAGADVLLLEAENHIGGHAICSGGNLPLGGGNSAQRKYGIEDSADIVFRDLTDWSIVQPNGFPDYRYNDREIVRAYADHCAATFEWLVAHGVEFLDKTPDNLGGSSIGNSALREMHPLNLDYPLVQTGRPVEPERRATSTSGNGLMRPLEAAASKAGVETLLQHRMTAIYREEGGGRRAVGIAVQTPQGTLDIRARKAVVIATGGSTGNVNFRRMFDPRLTEEYCGLAGMPWSNQDASGELAAMAIGASLWGAYNQTGEFGETLTKPGLIGTQYGYRNLRWMPGAEVFAKVGATGLPVGDWQNVVLVNLIGKRFYDETAGNYTSNSHGRVDPYTPHSHLNLSNTKLAPNGWIAAALAGIGDGHNGGGPIWAIFDAAAVQREGWTVAPPHVDTERGFFFSADTLAELARKIVMQHQRIAMPPENLEATIARFNSFVDAGKDDDFGRPAPPYKIATPPFYAAWATPVIHDTRAGLRINASCQVVDLEGRVIPGLYCGGESAGGFSMHGLARCMCQGYIVGMRAAAEPAASS